MPKKVCIIGSGGAGLTSIKACLEEGHIPKCYDMYDSIGGLWVYKETVGTDGLASVMKSTVINTSKEMSAFSDYPPESHLPNYMHNTLLLKYIEGYAKTYDLEKHVTFKTRVIKVDQREDFAETGQWDVTLLNLITKEERIEVFDAIMVCTGHHVYPHTPSFPNQDSFKGELMHSHAYKRPNGYEDKSVVIIGAGNSGVDAAIELSQVTNKVYLSTRRGCWVIHRVGPRGHPFDAYLKKRSLDFLLSWMPFNLKCSLFEAYVNQKFDHEVYSIKPKHRIFSQHTVVNDALPNRILSGVITIKGNVKEFTEHGVIFENETEETKADLVILATGYEYKYPFISDEVMKVEKNKVELFKYVFPPRLAKPTLAFIGLIQPLGAIFPAAEMQSRWFTRILAGKEVLPSKEEMLGEIHSNEATIAGRYTESYRHTIQADWIPYMDDLATRIGVKPSLWDLLFNDFELFKSLSFGPCLTYQYRLKGPHSWSKARETILSYDSRVKCALASRKVEKSPPGYNFLLIFIAFIMLAIFLGFFIN